MTVALFTPVVIAFMGAFGALAAPPPTTKSAADPASSGPAASSLYQATIQSIDGSRALTVTGIAAGAQHVDLSPRARVLHLGKAALLTDFHPHDTVILRAHPGAGDHLIATLVEDDQSERLAALARRPPLLKVTAIDAKTGQVTLQSADGSIQVQVQRSRLRLGRHEFGALVDLTTGQTYASRLVNAPDGQPGVSLANPEASASGRKKTAPTPQSKQ